MNLAEELDALESPAPDDEATPLATIPLEHAIMLASPPDAAEAAATIGLSPIAVPPTESTVEPYQHLSSRGSNLNAHNLNPEFANRLSRALMDAEAATGQQAVLRDLYRPPERQAQYYANYTQRPVMFGGHTYYPGGQGGLAAPPGQSRHGRGEAADVGRGAVLDFLHRNARNYGLEFLSGKSFERDPVHIQLAGSQRINEPTQVSATTHASELPVRTAEAAVGAPGSAVDADANQLFMPASMEVQQEPDPYIAQQLDDLLEPARNIRPLRRPIDVVPETSTNSPVFSLTQTPLTVVGADGALQTINQMDHALDPIAGMDQGIMLSPEVQAVAQSENAPVYGQVPNVPIHEELNQSSPVDMARNVYESIAGTEPDANWALQGAGLAAAIPTYLARYFAIDPILSGARMTKQSFEGREPDIGDVFGSAALATGGRIPFAKPGELGVGGSRVGAGRIPQPTTSYPPPAISPATSMQPVHFSVVDYMRTADDQNAGLLRYGSRIGMSQPAYDNMRSTFQVSTGATSQTLADSAATLGRAEAPNFVYRVNTPLPEIKLWASDHPGFNDYLNMFDTLDEINIRTNQNANQPNPMPGPITVRGTNLLDAQTAIRNWERANPQFVQARDRFRENLLETRRFAANGEYAIISQQELTRLNRENPNEVPWSQRVIDPLRTDITRADPSDAMGYYTTTMVRRRINNEAVGLYVDEVASSPGGRDMFTRRDAEYFRQNPDRRAREVTFYRRGELEHWEAQSRTVADLLKQDPYFYSSGMAGEILGAPRRLFQSATTGLLAPYFSVRDMLRNTVISQMTTAGANARGSGLSFLNPFNRTIMRPPSFIGIGPSNLTGTIPFGPGTLPWAFASQVLPQLARHISVSLDSSSGNFLRALGGARLVNGVSGAMARAYIRSTFAQLEAMGSHSGSYMGRSADASLRLSQTQLANWVRQLGQTPGFRDFAALLNGYKNMLTAIHNSPQMAFVQRNRGRAPLTSLAAETRELTGNPQMQGRFSTPQGRMIKFDTEGAPLWQRMLTPVAHGYARANEMGRVLIPWYNMTQQGIKRFGTAALQNPTEFSARLFTHYILPTGLIYYWNTAIGNDPEGVSYVDHMMNRRDEYSQSMFWYLGIPGKPVRDGVEFPSFQEGVLPKRLAESALYHMYGTNPPTSFRKDALAALVSALDIAVVPPTPPLASILFAMANKSPPQNLASFPFVQQVTGLGNLPGIGGEIYDKRDDPFDQNKQMSSTIEGTLRAIVPSIADITIAGMTAWGHTPKEMGALIKAQNFAKQSGRRLVERTDVLRDLADLHPPMTGNSRSASRMFERQKEIEQLDAFYKKFAESAEPKIGRDKPLSKSGYEAASQHVEFPPPTSPGLGQQGMLPTNPLYLQFMKQLYDRTKHDSTGTGGFGYRSMWDAYRQWSTGVREMRNIDYGNMVTWQRRLQEKPDVMRLLQNANVDPNNPWSVRNLYERKRFNVTRAINYAIDAIEYEMSQQYGRPIRIKDLDPYNAPSLTQTVAPEHEQALPWSQ